MMLNIDQMGYNLGYCESLQAAVQHASETAQLWPLHQLLQAMACLALHLNLKLKHQLL